MPHGRAHSLALSSGGAVFAFGRASSGQCGLGASGANAPNVLRPTRVAALAALPAREVRARGDASAALVSAEAGSAYQWGVVGESPPVALPRIAAAEAAAL